MKCIGIIPARYASSRFPGKPLVDIAGKSMIQRVYEQAKKCTALSDVIVATDHEEIFRHVENFGRAVMTGSHHESGTSRCHEAISLIKGEYDNQQDIVINIQGDEPFIHPLQIELVIGCFADPAVRIASLQKKIESLHELFDENVVKVVTDNTNKALLFSRSPIPFCRDIPQERWLSVGTWYKHIGLYGYRMEALGAIAALPHGNLEKTESLEQLRWIENGIPVHMNETGMQHLAIDTPEDLQRALDGMRNCTDNNEL